MKVNSQVNDIVKGIVDYMRSKQALALLPEVAEQLTRQSWLQVDPNLAVVSAPVKLTVSQQKALKAKLDVLLGRNMRLKTKIDPTIVAGIRIEVAGQVIDATINAHLKDLQEKIIYD